jgi:enoyl-CoA hydratase/carnithine racemase
MKTDYKTIKVELQDGIVVFTMDNPPVNQLSQHFVQELAEAFTEAYEDEAIKAIVLTGSGKNFIAGADITQIKDVKTKDELLPKLKDNNRFLNAIEMGPKPVLAAINGNCLGGGLALWPGNDYHRKAHPGRSGPYQRTGGRSRRTGSTGKSGSKGRQAVYIRRN